MESETESEREYLEKCVKAKLARFVGEKMPSCKSQLVAMVENAIREIMVDRAYRFTQLAMAEFDVDVSFSGRGGAMNVSLRQRDKESE